MFSPPRDAPSDRAGLSERRSPAPSVLQQRRCGHVQADGNSTLVRGRRQWAGCAGLDRSVAGCAQRTAIEHLVLTLRGTRTVHHSPDRINRQAQHGKSISRRGRPCRACGSSRLSKPLSRPSGIVNFSARRTIPEHGPRRGSLARPSALRGCGGVNIVGAALSGRLMQMARFRHLLLHRSALPLCLLFNRLLWHSWSHGCCGTAAPVWCGNLGHP
jgi:hypothetical protein